MLKKKSALKDAVCKRVDTLYSDMVQLPSCIDGQNIYLLEREAQRFYEFLVEIKDVRANSFLGVNEQLRKKADESIVKNGALFEYEIPVSEVMEKWKRTEQWEHKLLQLTHDVERSHDTFNLKSRLSKQSELKSVLIDLISTNVPTDDNFPMSYQQWLSIIDALQTGMFFNILVNREDLKEFFSMINSAIHYMAERVTDQSFEKDAKHLFATIDLCVSNSDNEYINHALHYSAAIFICAFAEKITREIYADLIKEVRYVDASKASLGDLFGGTDELINSVFDKRHVNNIAFFLSTVGEKRIGHNYRNKLAHLSKIKIDSIDDMFVARLLWLFTDIVNTWFWYFIRKDYLRENEDERL